MPLKMKCNRDPSTLYSFTQNRGTIGEKMEERMPSGSLLVPGAAFLSFWD